MKKVIKVGRVPIKMWLDDLEEGALEQTVNLSNLPFVFKQVVLMPDAHQGYGMPIGGILATKGYIVPNAVGVDIGCGMCSVKTNIHLGDLTIDDIKKIMSKIRERIPVGFNKHNEKQPLEFLPQPSINLTSRQSVVIQQWENAQHQIGTLGGGNHFIELQKDKDNILWIMIHSGSRNLGKKVADHYNKIARNLNERWFSEVKKDKDLAFLPLDSKEGKEYLEEMNFCVEFALCNRKLMLKRILESIQEVCYEKNITYVPEELINIPHNYCRIENHFNENVIVHRKGATSAKEKEVGIIPGSQGTCSYIVLGLGNPESFCSCSHGAGRKMGRNVARRTLNLQEEVDALNKKGIIHAIRNVTDLDEAPGSYKDIEIVMENQNDLVKILVRLEPVGVVKG
ncbi:MAG: RtcB family protein [Nanoarchaeota archaeon]|nr:RtcB family protein [Nanoarchaeota archaeon]